MEIDFKDKDLLKCYLKHSTAITYLGKKQAKKFLMRVNELANVKCLEDLRNYPPARCHELKGNRKEQFAVKLDEPYRLIFTPTHDPIPAKEDGGMDWKEITEITILEIVNYHD